MSPKPYEDDRWDLERPVEHDDFNEYNDVAIFEGPILSMYKSITARELKTLLERSEDIVLVDVREKNEYEKGHICGSINMPAEFIERDAPDALAEDSLIVVSGGSPEEAESAVGVDKLATIGYKHILRFTGGIKEWKEAGYCFEGPRKAA